MADYHSAGYHLASSHTAGYHSAGSFMLNLRWLRDVSPVCHLIPERPAAAA